MKKHPTVEFSPDRLGQIPAQPGIYLMKNAEEKVIYVGKAKNLRNRVRSYFTGRDDGRYNVQFLLGKIRYLETIVTDDERQAILLEANLVKQYKPRYNIRLKDDKAHLLVRVDLNHEWPRLELVRAIRDDGARYFGPFAFGHELYTLLEIIKRTIPLRTCSDRAMNNRIRPCLEFQIKRCAAPCCFDLDRGVYLHWVDQAISILEGRNREVLGELEGEMERASRELRYEQAALLRDRLQLLRRITAEKSKLEVMPGSRDAFGIYREGSEVEVSIIRVRQGRLFEALTFGFSEVEIPDEELLASVLGQYYTSAGKLPDEILVPFALEDYRAREELYRENYARHVRFRVPLRGPKARLVLLAAKNAQQNFSSRFSAKGDDAVLKALQGEFQLEEAPRLIECVDISHFQGGETVGAVVTFAEGRPDKSRYRRFHLSQQGTADDFASVREVVLRHLSRAAEENTIADLMIIDGGAAQLSQAVFIRNELGLSRPVMIGLAKRRGEKRSWVPNQGAVVQLPEKPERVFVEGRAEPIVLDAHSQALHLLERIRNEAHRFAITFHRGTRSRRIFRSELELIPGIGPKRRQALLRIFGGVSELRTASIDDLVTRGRIPEKLAQRIREALNKTN